MNHKTCYGLAIVAGALVVYVAYDIGYRTAKNAIVDSCNRQRSFYGESQTFKCLPVVPRITTKDWG